MDNKRNPKSLNFLSKLKQSFYFIKDCPDSKHKDGWDIVKIIAEICIAIAIFISGLIINSTLKNKELQVKYVEIAIQILQDKSPIRSVEEKELREWATKVINKYAEIPLSDEGIKGLEKNLKRPFLEIRLINNKIPYENKPSINLPYAIVNIGDEPAKNVHKGYISFIVDKLGRESIIQSYVDPENKKVDLLPLETSLVQLASVDAINISKFDPKQVENIFIKVVLKLEYLMINPNETLAYYTKLTLELIPEKTSDGTIVFNVSQKLSDHGRIKNDP